MKPSLYLLFFLLACGAVHAQQDAKNAVKMLSWSGGECDKDTDPYRRVNRISKMRHKKDKLYITVSFTDNCCITLKPSVSFNDHVLHIQPYGNARGDACDCDCCFSLDLVLDNITDTSFTTVFKSK